mgnify:CR=1 FL=1
MMSDCKGLIVAEETYNTFTEKHILIGLGAADRNLLCTCLALFDCSTIQNAFSNIVTKLKNLIATTLDEEQIQKLKASISIDLEEEARSFDDEIKRWFSDTNLTDDKLRLILWAKLQDAFQVQPSITSSTVGAEKLTTELTAGALSLASPEKSKIAKLLHKALGKERIEETPICLDGIIFPTINELFNEAFDQERLSEKEQLKLIRVVRKNLNELDQQDLDQLLESLGTKELNDSTIRSLLMTSGGWAAFSSTVGLSGFAPYIIAAQASAYIPLVSGPALVSFVSVLSNPLTTICGSAALVWWLSSEANTKSATLAGLRIISLLAMNGLSSPSKKQKKVINAFEAFRDSKDFYKFIPNKCNERYKQDLLVLKDSFDIKQAPVEDWVLDLTERKPSRPFRKLADEIAFSSQLSALTLGDIILTNALINPHAIEGIDFARQPDLGDPTSFGIWADKVTSLSPAAYMGNFNGVKGYVAEQMVAAELVSTGHDVEFPSSSSQAGWDLIVDGVETQVKCIGSISGLRDHFDKYDYPVIANSELASSIDHLPVELAEKVFFIEGFSDRLVTQLTSDSIHTGVDLLNPNIPTFALGLSACRQFFKYKKGEISGDQAIEMAILEGSTRVGLAIGGGYIGTGIGLLFYGPAGALILSNLLPVISQLASPIVLDQFKDQKFKAWEQKATLKINASIDQLLNSLQNKIYKIQRKVTELSSSPLNDYYKSHEIDRVKYLTEIASRLCMLKASADSSPDDKLVETIGLFTKCSLHPVSCQEPLKLISNALKERPSRISIINELPFWEKFKSKTHKDHE